MRAAQKAAARVDASSKTLLRIDELQVRYGSADEPAVDDVSLEVRPGEVLGVVGESGSGKTTVIRAALGLLPSTASVTRGTITFGGADVTGWNDREFAGIRGPYVGFVPQDPATSLNPVKRIGRQVVEAILLHDRRLKGQAARERAIERLRTAGLEEAERVFAQYPHELSGGMKQRALIAIALASGPKLLIADEPTSALDVTVQKTILDHLEHLRSEFNLGVLLVTHDLGVATERADRLIVMQRGRVVEQGRTAEVLADASHPYTQALLKAAPSAHSGRLVATRKGAGAVRRSRRDLLIVDRVTKHYPLGERKSAGTLAAVSEASFRIAEGTTHAIVGESGAGKSTIVRLALGLTRPQSGSIHFDGEETAELSGRDRRAFRRNVQFVYQNPFSSLDPTFSVRRLLAEPLRVHRAVESRAALDARVHELISAVALDDGFLDRRPNELSGGQAQRVAIARALALHPKLLVLDEAVSALDVSVQAQVLQLLVNLQAEHGLTYLFVTHDLGVVRLVADTVSVMRRGEVVEEGPVEPLFAAPADPYTRALINAIPGRSATAGAA